MAEICRGTMLATDDPLGLGGLLFDACRIVQLATQGKWTHEGLLERVLDAILEGLEAFEEENLLRFPAAYRLAFRELGLSIGLHGLEKMQVWVRAHPQKFPPAVPRRLEQLSEHLYLREKIEQFWLNAVLREEPSWNQHREINIVMLATCLGPDGFLAV